MNLALSTSKNKIDYINTHGTSTPVGDITELKAVGETFKEKYLKLVQQNPCLDTLWGQPRFMKLFIA